MRRKVNDWNVGLDTRNEGGGGTTKGATKKLLLLVLFADRKAIAESSKG